MKNYGTVRSSTRPESMVIDEYSVWINENIQEIEVEDEIENSDETTEKSTHIEYEYTMIQYTKNEYISLQEEQIIDTQVALCEIYESLGV